MMTFYNTVGSKEDILVMTDVQTLLARNLKKYRKILGFSQAQLAERANCSTTFIGNIEIKKRFPSPQYLDRIVKALDIKPEALFAEKDDPKAITQYAERQKRKAQLEKDVIKAVSKIFRESNA
jgi:transcriptional regulator with XRE-family HTH domain